jgi:hypothetical protein
MHEGAVARAGVGLPPTYTEALVMKLLELVGLGTKVTIRADPGRPELLVVFGTHVIGEHQVPEVKDARAQREMQVRAKELEDVRALKGNDVRASNVVASPVGDLWEFRLIDVMVEERFDARVLFLAPTKTRAYGQLTAGLVGTLFPGWPADAASFAVICEEKHDDIVGIVVAALDRFVRRFIEHESARGARTLDEALVRVINRAGSIIRGEIRNEAEFQPFMIRYKRAVLEAMRGLVATVAAAADGRKGDAFSQTHAVLRSYIQQVSKKRGAARAG